MTKKIANTKLRKCSICNRDFSPKNSRQHLCGDASCKSEHARKQMREWKWKTGRADPNRKNWWTKSDIEFLQNNRYLSTEEISLALSRSAGSVKEKRSRLKLHRLGICDICKKEYQRKNQHKCCDDCVPDQHAYYQDYINSLNGRWQMYKSNAKRRKIKFNISIQYFANFWQKDCYYCGKNIETIGIDRINSSLPYEEGNVTSCCSRCNEMKMDKSYEEWIFEIKNILYIHKMKNEKR